MHDLLSELESVDSKARTLAIHQRLTKRFPNKRVFFTDDGGFVLSTWAGATKAAEVTAAPEFNVRKVHLDEHGAPQWYTDQGHELVRFEGKSFEVFTVEHKRFQGAERWSWLVGDADDDLRRLFQLVVDWNSEVHGEVLIFSKGCFSKSHALQQEVEATRFDDLVLPPELATAIRADVKHFLASRELYEKSGATWKRGMLLMGPPGNGKTHAIKALIKEAGLPCVYVKSFSGRYVDPADAIPTVFKRARSLAPCVVVLEDLDSLVDDENRSFLLNELDGFASNTGLLTIASTNHPERLDPSLPPAQPLRSEVPVRAARRAAPAPLPRRVERPGRRARRRGDPERRRREDGRLHLRLLEGGLPEHPHAVDGR